MWFKRRLSWTSRDRLHVEAGVLTQDRRLQIAELRPGVDAELLPERHPGRAERLERVGLATSSVESGDKERLERLVERFALGERTELRQDMGVTAHQHRCPHRERVCCRPHVAQMPKLTRQHARSIEFRQRISPPEGASVVEG